MKKLILLFFSILFIIHGLIAQQEVSWKTLSDIKWVKAYYPQLEDYYDYPKFGKSVRKLENQWVTIKGFYVPVDLTGKMFALSASPSTMCFFCNGAGPETVMEMVKKKNGSNWKQVKTDQFIEVKGRLKLNVSDINHLMYVLEETELVQIIK